MRRQQADDEILVEVRIPVAPKGQGWGFHEVNVRKGDFAIVAAAATLQIAAGKCARLFQSPSRAWDPMRSACRRRRKRLSAERRTDAAFREAAAACAAAIDPNSDIHGSAEYRRDLAKTLIYRALCDARDRCG